MIGKKRWPTWIQQKKGFAAIEAVFVMTFFILFLSLGLAFFLLIHSYGQIQQETHALATLAERQGGLTTTDVEQFQGRLAEYSFIGLPEDVKVQAKGMRSGTDATVVDPIGTPNGYYIKRDSNDLIEIVVTTPSNGNILNGIAGVLGVGNAVSHYQIKEVIYSERY